MGEYADLSLEGAWSLDAHDDWAGFPSNLRRAFKERKKNPAFYPRRFGPLFKCRRLIQDLSRNNAADDAWLEHVARPPWDRKELK